MSKQTYPKGTKVEFTLNSNRDFPLFTEWKDGNKKGRGIVVGYDSLRGYLVEVTDPIALKGLWYFDKSAIRRVVSTATATAPTQSAHPTGTGKSNFQIGDEVEFSFEDNGRRPSLTKWNENNKKGRGIVSGHNPTVTPYTVKIIHPQDPNLNGFGWLFAEDALRPLQSAQTFSKTQRLTVTIPIDTKEQRLAIFGAMKSAQPPPTPTQPKPEWNEYEFFTQKKNESTEKCPRCLTKTEASLTNLICPKCGWKKLP
jgi:hypothetical protein